MDSALAACISEHQAEQMHAADELVGAVERAASQKGVLDANCSGGGRSS